jgi:tRNA (mo5U34)-methyltransferase
VGLKRAWELKRSVARHPYWWHSIDLGSWVTTPGQKSRSQLKAELASLQLPDLRGKSVLDIGAWDGYFSFAAEGLGASRVVALDYHTWGTDMGGWRANASEPWRPEDEDAPPPQTWDPVELPGKRGFDIAREALGSRVESVFADILAVEPGEIGQFDLVLLLGVLYHSRYPVEMLERVAALTRETMVLETESFSIPGREGAALGEFFESNELMGDASNWWSFTEPALAGMCRTAGFESVRFLGPLQRRSPEASGLARHRAIAHASKSVPSIPVPPG